MQAPLPTLDPPPQHLRAACVDLLMHTSAGLPMSRLSRSEAQAVADAVVFARWADGTHLSNPGDPLATAPFFFLVEGHVCVQIPLPDGRPPVVAAVEQPGSVFGTDVLFMPTQRYARYVADGDVVCALFTAASLDAFAKRRPEVAFKLMVGIGAQVFRNFRVNVKRLALDAAMHLSEKEQFEGELAVARRRAKVALGLDPDAPDAPTTVS